MSTTLSSERLILRPWREDDLDALAQLCADPEVMAHFPVPLDRAGSAELLGKLMAHQAEHGFTFWALECRDTAGVIGLAGLARVGFVAPFVPAVEIGWRLARPYWGLGYALEAARRALQFAFEDLQLDEVVSFTVPANQRSWGLMQRLGMRRDAAGDFEHPNLPVGHPLRPHWLYRISREAWHGR
ncbi:Protein N-acetyltransferase, RimJ/RimL family [Aquipseudomonas alcaligenes]|jgi:RimJ/RimL family protein N-acetyltransferase|uniref:GNAT family N-acetyltransferase n=1 Tax=Aquipseudomonas alcaligenes TaxID=43263 RepID=UPI0009570BF6|nr:GNAT family N-acetyltransferase [Pseudomonas alcaligenes]SIS04298.1 Protein N-acetyltransferase, RimJ/RimL family [Pseudomonas alcaligenes]